MKSYLRVRSPLSQLGLFFLFLGAGIVITSFLSVFVLMLGGASLNSLKDIDFSDPRQSGVLKLLQGVSTVVIFLLPAFAFAFVTFRRRPLFFLGFHKPSLPVYYLLGFLVMLLAFPFVSWLGQLNEKIPLAKWMVDMEKDAAKQMDSFLKVRSRLDVFINLFVMALLPAICEEACFRGALQRILIQIFRKPWWGILFTAMFFSAFHMQFEGFLPRMFLGIVLGALYWYSGSIWVNIVAHFFYNGLQVVFVIYFPKMVNENPSFPLLLAAISGLLVWGLLIFIRKLSITSFAKVYEFEEINEHNPFIA